MFAHRGDAVDPVAVRHGQIKIARHAADNRELLPILLAEEGQIGLHLIEQFEHHSCHAIEMAGPRGPAQSAADPAYGHGSGIAFRIHRRGVWCPDQADPFGGQQGAIGFKLAWIFAQILIGAELPRVDEDRYSHMRSARTGFAHQSQMALMQCAHGWHQRHQAVAAHLRQGASQWIKLPHDLHARYPLVKACQQTKPAPLTVRAAKINRSTTGHPTPVSSSSAPHRIVFANEKGGTGKSTTAVHVAVALAYQGARVAAIDLDARQRTLHRYLENRSETERRRGITLPTPRFAVFGGESMAELDALTEDMAQDADFLIFDTPGRDDPYARHVATNADTLVTPLNDSFVDFDLIGQVDAETFKVRRLSFYAELIWEARKKRAMATISDKRREMDWVVVRNRTQHSEARNMKRLDSALTELSKRVGFRVSNGLSERVIYRELFPSGLTLLDKGQLGELGTSHLVARQELRALVASLGLPMPAKAAPELALIAPA